MKFFDEFSGFINDEQARAAEEERISALNERLAYRLRSRSYEETLQGLYGVLLSNAADREYAETVRSFA